MVVSELHVINNTSSTGLGVKIWKLLHMEYKIWNELAYLTFIAHT